MKKTLSFLLAMLMLGSSLAACASEPADDTANPTDTTTAAVEETTVPEDDGLLHDNLPERDFNGETITFLLREEMGYEFSVENTADVVNEAVHNRNIELSERFKVNFKYVQQPGAWASRTTYTDLITGMVLAGDSAYNIITGQSNIVLPLAVKHLFHDLANAEHIDFTKAYWKEGYHSNATINGRLYSLMGDYALSTLNNTNCMIFNKTMFDNNKIEYPYQLVKDGKWTLDAFIELSSKFVKDLDGDGKMTNADQYALGTNGNGINPFNYSTGCTVYDLDENGKYILNFPSEQELDVFDTLFDFLTSTAYANTDKIGIDSATKVETFFATDHSAFCSGRLMTVENLRDMKSDFGIVPYPKYNEEQENYISSVLRTVTVASIPTTYAKPEKCTFILEAMSAYGYNYITPAYYEVALKGKYTRDTLTAEMLDIISTTTYFSFGDVFYTELGGQTADLLTVYINAGTKGLASFVESRKGNWAKKLDDLLKAYAE